VKRRAGVPLRSRFVIDADQVAEETVPGEDGFIKTQIAADRKEDPKHIAAQHQCDQANGDTQAGRRIEPEFEGDVSDQQDREHPDEQVRQHE
jgi:hypothetical protein